VHRIEQHDADRHHEGDDDEEKERQDEADGLQLTPPLRAPELAA
jgi:hypothetical protein